MSSEAETPKNKAITYVEESGYFGFPKSDIELIKELIEDSLDIALKEQAKQIFKDIKKTCLINSDTMFMTTIKSFEDLIEKKVKKKWFKDSKKL